MYLNKFFFYYVCNNKTPLKHNSTTYSNSDNVFDLILIKNIVQQNTMSKMQNCLGFLVFSLKFGHGQIERRPITLIE